MFDLKSYCEACGRLALAPERIEEMISMTENGKKQIFGRPARVVALAAALTAALGISAFAASPAGQELIESVKSLSVFVVAEPGEDGMLDINRLDIPDASIAQRDGRTIFTVDGKEIDITEELEKSGQFIFRSDNADGSYCELKVNADATVKATLYNEKGEEQMTLDLLDDGDVRYAVSVNEGMDDGSVTVTYKITGDEEGGLTVDDGNGNVIHYDSLNDIPASGATD